MTGQSLVSSEPIRSNHLCSQQLEYREVERTFDEVKGVCLITDRGCKPLTVLANRTCLSHHGRSIARKEFIECRNIVEHKFVN
jgi:hypothetical protein